MATAVKSTEAPKKEEPKVDVVDVIEPKVEPKARLLVFDTETRSFTQASLSFFNKTKFMGLVGETLDAAMKEGLSVNDVLEGGQLSQITNVTDIDSFMRLVSKVARYAPDFLKDCYLLWLNVPAGERDWARDALDNISDDEGIDIIETFIDQNWGALESFFLEKLAQIAKRVAQAREKATA